jgi:hypothetical protein
VLLKVNTQLLYFYSLCKCACLHCGLYNDSKFVQNSQGSKVILLYSELHSSRYVLLNCLVLLATQFIQF